MRLYDDPVLYGKGPLVLEHPTQSSLNSLKSLPKSHFHRHSWDVSSLFNSDKMHIEKTVYFFGADSPLRRCENSRFQTHIHSLGNLTGPPIFNQTGFIQTTPVGPKFYSSHNGEISLLQHICDNRSRVRGRTHTCTPFVTFNASHLFHFCHTHAVILLRDGNRLHATFAFMLAAYAVSETAIFTVEARWKSTHMFKKSPQFRAAADCTNASLISNITLGCLGELLPLAPWPLG